MRELIVALAQGISDHFDGETVGSGGTYGTTLTNGPFTITAYFHQWQDIQNPSIHVQVVQEVPAHTWFECCGGPTALTVNIRISVDQKEQSWSIAAAMYEELRSWLCDNNYQLGVDCDYLVFVDQSSIIVSHIYEGDVFSIHTMLNLTYLRRFE